MSITINHITFSRGPLYTSLSDGGYENNQNVYYVLGGNKNEDLATIPSAEVSQIPNGILITLSNRPRSQVKITLRDDKMKFESSNRELLKSLIGDESTISCDQ